MSELEDAVRRWAQGVYPVEAGAELLIRQKKAIYEGAPWLRESGAGRGQRMVAIDTSRLSEWAAAWSGSERRVAAVALSLIEDRYAVNLYDAVTGLDPEPLELVLAAIAHAAGSHEARMPLVDGTTLTGFSKPVNAHPWPERLNTLGSAPRPSRAVAHEPGDVAGGPGRSL
jgi:hypothetical protein